MSLCVMFSRFEQQHHHRDGRNNKADRSRHLWQPWVERAANFDDHSRSLSLRCSAMEGTVGTVGKWKRERRHRAVCTSSPPPSHYRNSQEPLDMTTTAGNASSRALPKERASVIMSSSPITGHRVTSSSTAVGMSDPVIDEHFRRSLGKDYMNVFAPAVVQREPPQQLQQSVIAAPTDDNNPGLSEVDDHFAKALGDTWVKLQKEEYQKKRKETTAVVENGRQQQKVNVYVL